MIAVLAYPVFSPIAWLIVSFILLIACIVLGIRYLHLKGRITSAKRKAKKIHAEKVAKRTEQRKAELSKLLVEEHGCRQQINDYWKKISEQDSSSISPASTEMLKFYIENCLRVRDNIRFCAEVEQPPLEYDELPPLIDDPRVNIVHTTGFSGVKLKLETDF